MQFATTNLKKKQCGTVRLVNVCQSNKYDLTSLITRMVQVLSRRLSQRIALELNLFLC